MALFLKRYKYSKKLNSVSTYPVCSPRSFRDAGARNEMSTACSCARSLNTNSSLTISSPHWRPAMVRFLGAIIDRSIHFGSQRWYRNRRNLTSSACSTMFLGCCQHMTSKTREDRSMRYRVRISAAENEALRDNTGVFLVGLRSTRTRRIPSTLPLGRRGGMQSRGGQEKGG